MVTDEFPFFSRCLKGDFAGGGGDDIVDCDEVPPGAPCCGDGICGGPETEVNCPEDCASGNTGPSLINFSIYADTVNTGQEPVNVGYVIEAEDSDNYLSTYTLRLIINGGPINGGETLESSGDFNAGLMSSSIAGVIEIPIGSTEGQWNIRIILRDDLDAVTNIGPNDLESLNFQNYIYVDNSILGQIVDNIPMQYSLNQNYPNPFNPITTIGYIIPKDGIVNITIFDMMGKEVNTILNRPQTAGYRSIQWNATNDQGDPVSAGIYLYRIRARDFIQTKKMILLK